MQGLSDLCALGQAGPWRRSCTEALYLFPAPQSTRRIHSRWQVLTWSDTWQVWRSMNFIGHVLIVGILLVGTVLPPRRRRRKDATAAGSKPDAHGAAQEPSAAVTKKDS